MWDINEGVSGEADTPFRLSSTLSQSLPEEHLNHMEEPIVSYKCLVKKSTTT